MSMMIVRGVSVPVLEDSQFEGTHERGAPRRTITGHVVDDSTFRELWMWNGAAGPFAELYRSIWKLFLDGAGETFMFASGSTTGSRGSVPNGGGSYTASGSGGEYNGQVTVASGSFIELPSDIDPNEGWALRFYTDDGGGAAPGHYTVWGTGTNISAATVYASKDGAATVQASTLGLDNVITVASDGDVRFIGKTLAGVNAAVVYSELEIRDYPLVAAIGEGMSGVSEECYPLPYQRVGGTGIGYTPAGNARTIKARVFAGRESVRHLDGEHMGFVSVDLRQTR